MGKVRGVPTVVGSAIGFGTPPIGYSYYLSSRWEKNAQDLANKIYDLLSQELLNKISKEDLANEVYGLENELEALDYLKASGYKFKK